MKSILLILGIFLIGFISASALNVTFTEGTNDTYNMNFNLDYTDIIGYQIDICFDNNIEFIASIPNSPFSTELVINKVVNNKSILAVVTLGDAVTGNSNVGKFVFKLNSPEATLTICKGEVVLLSNKLEVIDFQPIHVFNGSVVLNDTDIPDTNETEIDEDTDNGDSGGSSRSKEDEVKPDDVKPDVETPDVIDLTPDKTEVIDITPEPKSKIQAVKEWISNVFKSIGNWFKNLF